MLLAFLIHVIQQKKTHSIVLILLEIKRKITIRLQGFSLFIVQKNEFLFIEHKLCCRFIRVTLMTNESRWHDNEALHVGVPFGSDGRRVHQIALSNCSFTRHLRYLMQGRFAMVRLLLLNYSNMGISISPYHIRH